jgi:hypothetical protein
MTVWIDMENTFDKVRKSGLNIKLLRSGVSGGMFNWKAISHKPRQPESRCKVTSAHKQKYSTVFPPSRSITTKYIAVQDQVVRIITGVLKSTPVNCIESITGLQSMEDRRCGRVLQQAEKLQRLT